MHFIYVYILCAINVIAVTAIDSLLAERSVSGDSIAALVGKTAAVLVPSDLDPVGDEFGKDGHLATNSTIKGIDSMSILQCFAAFCGYPLIFTISFI